MNDLSHRATRSERRADQRPARSRGNTPTEQRILSVLSQGFSYMIVLASALMLTWGLLGSLEYVTGMAPLMRLQNPTFPPATQAVHWILITLSGATFLAGYVFRWRSTPIAMLALFASLSTMCAIQTFDFMENPDRYRRFAQEVLNYTIITIYLFRSKRTQARFRRRTVDEG